MAPFPGNLESPGPAIGVHAEFGAHSQSGPLRSHNEDHYLILRLARQQETLLSSLPEGEVPPRFDELAYGMVIADGRGQTGEIASRLAITSLAHLSVHFGKWNVRIDDPIADEVIDRAARFFKNVDAELLDAGRHDPAGLQTTLTAVYSAGDDLFFAYVGDSRAYMFRDGELMRLTRDRRRERSRLVLVTPAGVRPADAPRDETLGATRPSGPRVEVERCGLLDGDVILLCTNGLSDVVDDARIAEVLRSPAGPTEQCQALVALAASLGSQDDLTAVIARYHIAPRADVVATDGPSPTR